MFRPSTLLFLLLIAAAQVQAQAPMPERPGEAPQPPAEMRGGFGKGKGKGRGRPMTPPTPPTTVPASPPAPATPSQAPAGTPPALQSPGTDFFARKIQPVLQQKCFECHQTGRKMKGGLAVDSHAALLAGGDSGPALVPGDAAKSLLYESMTHADADLQMPPRERLSAAVLADFKQWIEMGAPFSTSGAPAHGGTPAAPAAEGAGFFATITAVRGNSVAYTRDGGGGIMMRGGIGKGKGKGGMMRTDGGEETTQRLADKALVTTAVLARRTQELLVGLELSGGISNPAFEAVRQGGVRAHLVVKDGQITELNLITAQEESDAPIAVKPKRPPTKSNGS